jgi:hypothetical protein
LGVGESAFESAFKETFFEETFESCEEPHAGTATAQAMRVTAATMPHLAVMT